MDPSNKPLLPINDQTFKTEINNFFSLSIQDISKLLDKLEEKYTQFSVATILKAVNLHWRMAASVKNMLVYLIVMIGTHPGKCEIFESELLSLEIDKNKIGFFIKRTTVYAQKTFDACEIMYNVDAMARGKKQIGEFGADANYMIHKNRANQSFLFPVMHFRLRDKENEKNVITFNMDLDSLQLFIFSLQDFHDAEIEKLKGLKMSFGENVIIPEGVMA